MSEHPFLIDHEVDLVRHYRSERGCHDGYVLLSFRGHDEAAEIIGWQQHLGDPSNFVSGVVAVAFDWLCYETMGFTDYEVAEKWLPLLHEETKQFFQVPGGAA